jgi:hypothetical protein
LIRALPILFSKYKDSKIYIYYWTSAVFNSKRHY